MNRSKNILKALFLICTFISVSKISAQQIALPDNWKFTEGDNLSYKEINFDDSHWQTVNVNAAGTQSAMTAEKSYGWYRVSFDLSANDLKEDIMFLPGCIDDADETYLNGVLIGHTGSFPPNDQSAWDEQRNYLLKKELLKPHNVIAIRVYNGWGVGGIQAGTGIITQKVCCIAKLKYDAMVAAFIKQKKSYHQLTTSNGLIAAVYNFKTDRIENVYPHIFSYYDSAKSVMPFAQNIHLKNNIKPLSVKYLGNTHVIEVMYKNFRIDYVAPFTTSEKILYAVVKGEPGVIKNISFITENPTGGLISNETVGINKGHEKYFLFSFKDSLEDNNAVVNKAALNIINKKNNLINDEVKFMQNIFAECKLPPQLSPTEKKLAQQSVSFLKMSQVNDKEIFLLSRGQILASLRPGVWAISWVRDASFSIEAMSAIGMYDEAKKGLEFMLNANPSDQYIHYIHNDGKDYGIGVPYRISVTRYFGNGREESDFDDRGPNIELDDFGLFLTAFSDYINKSNDENFYRNWNNVIVNQVCAAIIHNIDSNSLIRQDSGPWEHHLPGKQFIFTNAVCAKGLLEIASLQKKYGLEYASINDAAQKLLNGINTNYLIDGKYYKGNVQEKDTLDHHYFDGATFEIFANGLINSKSIFESHMMVYDKILRASHDTNRGYMRFNSEDSYENQEWPFASLRVAISQNKFDNRAEAKKLIDRITEYASANYNSIPEIISLDYGIYKGAIPMVGYGAGAYLLALLDYYKK